jgi:hypothetical protein
VIEQYPSPLWDFVSTGAAAVAHAGSWVRRVVPSQHGQP